MVARLRSSLISAIGVAFLALATPVIARAQEPEVALAYRGYGAGPTMAPAALPAAAPAATHSTAASYAGRDAQGVPRYARRVFGADERTLLRSVFGIEEPGRLYLSDTLPDASLIYDTGWDRGEKVLVGSHRIGAPSARRPGESWEELERRLSATGPGSFPAAATLPDTALASLADAARPHFERMLGDARRAGFRVKIVETRRTPERQAYLITLDQHLTHTTTSRHSDGYAIDVIVGDGDVRKASTRRRWVAFRRWVAAYDGGRFRLIGTPSRSWDWPHIEFTEARPGFRSIDELLAAARWCSELRIDECTPAWRDGVLQRLFGVATTR